jgi:hypothetical protein
LVYHPDANCRFLFYHHYWGELVTKKDIFGFHRRLPLSRNGQEAEHAICAGIERPPKLPTCARNWGPGGDNPLGDNDPLLADNSPKLRDAGAMWMDGAAVIGGMGLIPGMEPLLPIAGAMAAAGGLMDMGGYLFQG